MSAAAPFTVGIIQDAASGDAAKNVAATIERVRDAAGKGAQVVCLKELFNAPYFCKAEKSERFDLAESIPGPTTERLQALAKELAIVLVVPLFERQARGVYRNSAAIIDADGALLGVYRKMHIPDDPLFYEKYYFTPGDAAADESMRGAAQANGFRVWKTRYANIGVLICWDQWYPEAARITSLLGADILFYPTAIGWHPAEKAEFGEAQVDAWRTAQRAHAIANGVFVAAPNRVGHEDEAGTQGLDFFGHSFIADPFGRMIAEAGTEPTTLIATCDPRLIEETRRNWPFLRDRRIDAYAPILVATSAVEPRLGMTVRFPAEFERHAATWIAWPHHEPDWPGKIEPIAWVYAEIVRVLGRHERVEILCHDEQVRDSARGVIEAHGTKENYRLHVLPTDRVWLRDSAPTVVVDEKGRGQLVNWRFNAWAKYDNYALDAKVGEAVARITGLNRVEPVRPDTGARVVLEGGAIDTDGEGTLLVTEECLLSDVQVRNPGLSREGYEQVFRDALGIRQTIWLGEGCVGDDTHGHVDDIARFAAPGVIALAYEADPADDENHRRSADNLERLRLAGFDGGQRRVVMLPYPRPVVMNGERLPASYANFYLANGVVIVPTFNDKNDRVALATIAELFPDREVVGIHAVDLVWGLGTLHCLTQQQPATA